MLIPILGNIISLLNRIGKNGDTTSTVHGKVGQSSDATGTGSTLFSRIGDVRSNMVISNSGSIIKSVQRGTVSVPASGSTTVTISSVNTSKAVVFPAMFGNPYNNATVSVTLTNATTLTFNNTTTGVAVSVPWEVVEYV